VPAIKGIQREMLTKDQQHHKINSPPNDEQQLDSAISSTQTIQNHQVQTNQRPTLTVQSSQRSTITKSMNTRQPAEKNQCTSNLTMISHPMHIITRTITEQFYNENEEHHPYNIHTQQVGQQRIQATTSTHSYVTTIQVITDTATQPMCQR
jgi:hypothetical protein